MAVILPQTILATISAPPAIRELATAPKAAARSFVSCANLVRANAIFHSILLFRQLPPGLPIPLAVVLFLHHEGKK